MRRILAILMVTAMFFTGCENNGAEKTLDKKQQGAETSNEDVNAFAKSEQESNPAGVEYKNRVTYKKAELAEKIREVNIGIKSCSEYLMMSKVLSVEDLKKYLPADNVRKVGAGMTQYVIEYPMENCNFVVIVGDGDRMMGTFVKTEKLHKKSELSQIKRGMTIKQVQEVFPEIIINTRVPEIVNKDTPKRNVAYAEIVLKGGKLGEISFEEKDNKFMVSEVEVTEVLPFFEQDEWNAIVDENVKATPLKGEVVLEDGVITKGKENWENFLKRTAAWKADEIKIMNYSISSESYLESRVRYDGREYALSSIVRGKEVDLGKRYKYLIERSGKLPNAEYGGHGFYLVNNENLTYERIRFSSLSSNYNDYIDYQTVFEERTR